MRKMISFKIENLPQKEREIVDRWADEQSNIQQSLANIIMHVVGFVGNVDVMDFDVQRKLHFIFSDINSQNAGDEQLVDTTATAMFKMEMPKNNQERDVDTSEMDVYQKASVEFEE